MKIFQVDEKVLNRILNSIDALDTNFQTLLKKHSCEEYCESITTEIDGGIEELKSIFHEIYTKNEKEKD